MCGAGRSLAIAGVLGLVFSYVTARITAIDRCAIPGAACVRQPHHPYLGVAIAMVALSILLLTGAALVGKSARAV